MFWKGEFDEEFFFFFRKEDQSLETMLTHVGLILVS